MPKPDEGDKALKQVRQPLNKKERWSFFAKFAQGLTALFIFYTLLTVFWTIGDDFATEFWQDAGFGSQPELFSASENPIAFIVTGSLIVLYFVKSNRLS